MADISVNIDWGAGPGRIEATEAALALLTSATAEQSTTNDVLLGVLQEEVQRAADSGEPLVRYGNVALAMTTLSRLCMEIAYMDGRRKALAEGDDAPESVIPAELLPAIASVLLRAAAGE